MLRLLLRCSRLRLLFHFGVVGDGSRRQILIEEHVHVSDHILYDNGLRPELGECGHRIVTVRAQQVGRPHDGQVLGGHVGDVSARGTIVKVTQQFIHSPV